jgi:hypothetical protein
VRYRVCPLKYGARRKLRISLRRVRMLMVLKSHRPHVIEHFADSPGDIRIDITKTYLHAFTILNCDPASSSTA